MAASLTALATVVWSDLAEASQQPQSELSDDLSDPQPVKMSKVEHTPLPEFGIEEIMKMDAPRKGKRKSPFGSFEGY